MPYMILMKDKPGMGDTRARVRGKHLQYLDSVKAKLLNAGALIEDDGTGGDGSLYIVDTDDRAEAQRLLEGDPFFKAGLFGEITLRRWRKAFYNGQKLV